MDQQPHVRAFRTCICCGKQKDVGLVLCWPCHSKQKSRNYGGYSKNINLALNNLERQLACQALNARLRVV